MSTAAARFRVFVSFVVCTNDDGDELPSFVRDLDRFLAQHFDRHEIIVVDNSASSASSDRLAALRPALGGSLIHLELARKHDSEAAMLAGLSRTIGDFVFECEDVHTDWDLPLLIEIFERCAGGVDVVDASGSDPSWGRRQFFDTLTRFSYLDIPNHPTSVRIVSRRALNAMLDMREKVRYRRALYAATGYPHAAVRYEPTESAGRKPRQESRLRVGRGFDVIVSFSDIGLRLANVAALFFGAFAVVAITYTLAVFAFKPDTATGWTTIMLMVSIGFAGVFIVLSLIAEYVSRILIEVRQRPAYTVRAVTVVPAHHDDEQLPLTSMADATRQAPALAADPAVLAPGAEPVPAPSPAALQPEPDR